MAVESDADLEAMFSTDDFGETAIYTGPGSGATPATVTVIYSGGHRETRFAPGAPLKGARHSLMVPKSALAVIEDDGTFQLTGRSLTLRVKKGGAKLDSAGRLWKVGLAEDL